MAKKKTRVDEAFLAEIESLASAGSSKSNTAKIMECATSLFSRNQQVKQAFLIGEQKYRKEVTELWHKKMKDDTAILTANVKRLSIHQDPIIISKPESISDCKNILASMIQRYARNEITQSQLKAYEATLKSFVSLVEVGELENRIIELEAIATKREEDLK
jgi:hypothetical protein